MTGKRKRNPAVQSFTLQDWSAFAEVYGIPFRVGEYGAGASKGDMRKLLRAVTFIAYDASAIIPESMLIEFHEVNGSRGEQVFGSLIDCKRCPDPTFRLGS